jgi:MFS family permease
LAVCGTPLIAAAFVAGRRRAVIGGRIAFIGLASMVLAFCGGWAATYGWRAAYLLYAFAVVPLILVLIFVPRSISMPAERQEGRQPRQLWGIYGLNLVYGTGIAAVFVYAAFLQKELGIHTPKLAGALSALASFTTIAVALAFPFIIRWASVRVLVVASFGLLAAGCLVLAAADNVAGVTAGLVLAGTGMGLFTPTSTEMVLQYSLPQRRGRAVGLTLMSIYLGNFFVPFAMTTVTRNGFTVGDGYLWLSGLYVVAALAGVVLARTLFAEPSQQSGASATSGLLASNQEI